MSKMVDKVKEVLEVKPAKKSHHLKPGEKVAEVKKGVTESPHYDKTEAVPGLQVGKKAKYC